MVNNFKKVFLFIVVTAVLLSSTACGSPSSSPSNSNLESVSTAASDAASSSPASSTQEAAKPAESVTLSLLINQTWNKASLQPSIDNFMKANPDVKIDLQNIPDAQYPQLLNTKVSSNEVPDMTMYNIGLLKQYFDAEKTFLPLTDQPWVSRLVNPDAVKVNGQVYGLPMNAMGSLIGVFYNKSVFEKNSITIPKTYDEFVAVCKKLKGSGVNPVMLTAKDAWCAVMWTVNLFPNAVKDNPDVWKKINTNQAKFADYKEFEDAFTMYKSLVDSGYVNSDYLSATYDMGVDSVATGKSAMIVQGDWWAADTTKKYPDAKLGLFPIPFWDEARLGCGHTQTYNIFAASKYTEQCKRFLNYCSQVDVMTTTCKDWNCIPGLNDVNVDLPYYVKEGLDTYVNSPNGGMPYPDMGINLVIGIDEMIKITQEMVAGGVSPKDAISEWDTYYSTQAKARKLPGW